MTKILHRILVTISTAYRAVAPHSKAIVAGIVTIGGALRIALADGHISGTEWTTLTPLVITAIGAVWGIPNVTARSGSDSVG